MTAASDANETFARAEFAETHGDALQELQAFVERLAAQGTPPAALCGMLIGGGVGMLVDGGTTPADVRAFVTLIVDKVIKAPRA